VAYFESIFDLLDDGWTPREGDGFSFGNYHDLIDWRVLKVEAGNILAIANNVIEWKPFDVEGGNDWEKSSLRKWLNEEFAPKAFISDPDEETIDDQILVKNENGDYVSLLNYSNAEGYCDILGELSGTSANLQLAYEEEFGDWYEGGNLAYWLSPENGRFAYVDCYGDASILTEEDMAEEYWKGKNDFSKPLGVRPAIWINTKTLL